MNKLILGIALPFTFLISTTTVLADNSFYVAANALNADYESEEDASGFNVALGTYLGNRVSVEVGYADFGSVGDAFNEFDSSSVQLSAIGYLPIGNKGGVFGRIGAERIKLEGSIVSAGQTIRGSNEETNPFFGIGGYYNVLDNVDVRVEYQKHEIFEVDVDTISAGLTVSTF